MCYESRVMAIKLDLQEFELDLSTLLFPGRYVVDIWRVHTGNNAEIICIFFCAKYEYDGAK